MATTRGKAVPRVAGCRVLGTLGQAAGLSHAIKAAISELTSSPPGLAVGVLRPDQAKHGEDRGAQAEPYDR